jgi:hypothetical protein
VQPAASTPPGSGVPASPPEWGESPAEADAAGKDAFAQRPEIYVGAAFVGGLVVAQLIRRLRRDN